MRLLTPRGPGAVAVLEIGHREREVLSAQLRGVDGQILDLVRLAGPRLAVVHDGDRALDQVLVVPAPEGRTEVHLHGSEAVLDRIARRFGGLDPGPPDPAEALMGRALDGAQLALALEQRALSFAETVAGWRTRAPAARRAAARSALARTPAARALARLCPVVLAGRRNAGKSTLLNRLLFRERALAGATAGLTRDPVRALTCLSGYPYELVDTAGEGRGEDPLERAALARGRRARRGALCLLVVDGSRGPGPGDRVLLPEVAAVVRSKGDLEQAPWPADVPCHLTVRCPPTESSPGIRRQVGELLRSLRRLPPAGPAGGIAALDPDQERVLQALADGGGDPGEEPVPRPRSG